MAAHGAEKMSAKALRRLETVRYWRHHLHAAEVLQQVLQAQARELQHARRLPRVKHVNDVHAKVALQPPADGGSSAATSICRNEDGQKEDVFDMRGHV